MSIGRSALVGSGQVILLAVSLFLLQNRDRMLDLVGRVALVTGAGQGAAHSNLYAALGVVNGRLDSEVTERLLASSSTKDRETAARHASGSRAQAMSRRLIGRDPSAGLQAVAVTRLAKFGGADALPGLLRGLQNPASLCDGLVEGRRWIGQRGDRGTARVDEL